MTQYDVVQLLPYLDLTAEYHSIDLATVNNSLSEGFSAALQFSRHNPEHLPGGVIRTHNQNDGKY